MSLDQQLLYLINNRGSSPVLDFLMPRISYPEHYLAVMIPVALGALGLIAWLLSRDGARGRLVVLALVVGVGGADLSAAKLIKPTVGRLRPCRPEAALEGVIVRDSCRGRNSFPSNHAANAAAAAVILGWRFRRRSWIGGGMAAVIGYSRVYLGVHYPGDVVGGWILGSGLGVLVAWGVPHGWYRLQSGRGGRD